MTKRIDGKVRADRLVADVAAVTAKLKSQAGIAPGLCAVLVGEDPASQVYVRNKGKAAVAAGAYGNVRFWHTTAVQRCPLLRRLVGVSGNVANGINSTLLTHQRHKLD